MSEEPETPQGDWDEVADEPFGEPWPIAIPILVAGFLVVLASFLFLNWKESREEDDRWRAARRAHSDSTWFRSIRRHGTRELDATTISNMEFRYQGDSIIVKGRNGRALWRVRSDTGLVQLYPRP